MYDDLAVVPKPEFRVLANPQLVLVDRDGESPRRLIATRYTPEGQWVYETSPVASDSADHIETVASLTGWTILGESSEPA